MKNTIFHLLKGFAMTLFVIDVLKIPNLTWDYFYACALIIFITYDK